MVAAVANPFETVTIVTEDDSILTEGKPLAVKPVALLQPGTDERIVLGYIPMLFGIWVRGRSYSVLCPLLAELLSLTVTPPALMQPTAEACMAFWQECEPVHGHVNLSPHFVPDAIQKRVLANGWLRCTDQDYRAVAQQYRQPVNPWKDV